ncbi:MAG TPA: hypothetical protein VLF62_04310 [Candidatus Saccharimonadales bacterium]|nr:hypothetical protein [Candidatus Saccharimonadales bacterium]
MATYEEFVHETRSQGVTLHHMLAQQGRRLEPRLVESFAVGPDHKLLVALACAGALLRKFPDELLADKPIDLAAFGNDMPARTLAAICNAKLSPIVPGPGDIALPGPINFGKCVCPLAEERWVKTIEDPEHVFTKKPMAELFATGGRIGDKLVVARKAEHEQNALTFTEVNIDGIVYPPGSILNLLALGDDDATLKRNLVDMPNGYSLRDIGDIACAGFMRLSAFGLPPSQRAEYNMPDPGNGYTIAALQSELQANAVFTYMETLVTA